MNTGTTEASFQIFGISPVCKDKLKIIDSDKAIELAVTIKNVACRSSEPPLLLAFNLKICES